MPRTAPLFARRQFRRASMMLASTALLVGYSQMTHAAETENAAFEHDETSDVFQTGIAEQRRDRCIGTKLTALK